MLELVKILQIASFCWRNHTSDRPSSPLPELLCKCYAPYCPHHSASQRNWHFHLELRYQQHFFFLVCFSLLSLYFPFIHLNAEHNKVAKALPPLEWKPFICRLNLRFLTPTRRIFSVDVMGHLAVHSFSSHATYLGAQRLAALMWSSEIIKTLHIIKI